MLNGIKKTVSVYNGKKLKENLRSSTENQGNNSISTRKNFRFFDNRQKYLLFVSTCSEKEIISKWVGKEISLLNPSLSQEKMIKNHFISNLNTSLVQIFFANSPGGF